MFAEAECKGSKVTGLLLDAREMRHFVSDQASAIELHLGHLRISCQLQPDSQAGKFVIRDSRLCEWLQIRHSGTRRMPAIAWSLVPAGSSAFVLKPFPRSAELASKAASPRTPGSRPPEGLFRAEASARPARLVSEPERRPQAAIDGTSLRWM